MSPAPTPITGPRVSQALLVRRQSGTKPCGKWKEDPWKDSVNRRTLEWCVVANIYIYGLEQDRTALWLL